MAPPVIMPRRSRIRARRLNAPQTNSSLLNMVDRGLGWLMNKGLSALVSGFGDYKIATNSLLTGGLDPPSVVNTINNGSVIVRHREYLFDVQATTAFTIQPLPINPGLIQTFPWLSNIAQHFEQYKFRGLLFEFKSLSSDAVLSSATSSALGSVVMATQYNALNPPFPDKFTMENYEFANSSKPSISFIHPVECAKRDTSIEELYVRGGAAPSGSDLRLYDLGTFNVATVGMQADSGVAGELWCTYEVELIKPKINTAPEFSLAVDHFHLTSDATNTEPFKNNVPDAGNTIGGSLGSTTYSWPGEVTEGMYLVLWYLSGASAVTLIPTRTFVNCTGVNILLGDSISYVSTPAGAALINFNVSAIKITAAGASVQFSGGNYPTALNGDFFVFGLPNTLSVLDEIADLESADDDFSMEEVRRLVQRLMRDQHF